MQLSFSNRFHRGGLLVVAVAVLALSCGRGFVPPPVSSYAAAASGVAPSRLAAGYALHQAKCGNCHAFQDPSAHTPSQLANDILPRMAKKAELTPADEQAVLAYLLAVRKK